ncbi:MULTISPECIES: TetR family transcriptional regulator [unclassified Crossiella]|uniref:TetR/AcrR family transcriptional regulator n=1 Tax=unclassified Crossiella TaxID=2620835 RepID=UPI001FFEAC8A|nr:MULTISPECIES: TetR family transcriptional regulator [unclassified Crossiella]MCK2240210.1 TetR family transcriptional regulator [Crossiella sp. S99.2]MCK2253338.1 TetR family transcriptional regulator [Crossiella sp. S99.1]
MVQNLARRAALVDAAIEVLAREGARGLTFRAVDVAAGVPKGTASNYFANRDDLLHQVGGQVHLRLAPDPETLVDTMRAPRSRELVDTLMHQLLDRMNRDPAGYLALQELRLEATRRPELRAAMTETMQANFDSYVRFHVDSGLPGGAETVALLYLAMTGLVVEHLTLPEAMRPFAAAELVSALVARIVPVE